MSNLPKATNDASQDINRNRLFTLINSMSDAVLAIDDSLNITLSNSIAHDLLDSNNLKSKSLQTVFRPLNKAGEQIDIKSIISDLNTTYTTTDWRLKYADGSQVYLQTSIAPIHLAYGHQDHGGYVVLIRDITHEKSIEQEREEFISVVSHELRTPIAVAEGGISNAILIGKKEGYPPKYLDFLNSAHEHIVFLGTMINDLAMLSRAERGKLNMVVEEFDVTELVNSLVKDYQHQANKKGLLLSAKTDGKANMLSSSRLYVQEILQNFVTNALKYTEKGSVSVSVRSFSDGVEFSVADTGLGIARNDQAKLFDKFYRSSDWRIKKINGTGLGLYVSLKLAELIGGKLGLQSQLNKGSIFSLYVPSSQSSKQV